MTGRMSTDDRALLDRCPARAGGLGCELAAGHAGAHAAAGSTWRDGDVHRSGQRPPHAPQPRPVESAGELPPIRLAACNRGGPQDPEREIAAVEVRFYKGRPFLWIGQMWRGRDGVYHEGKRSMTVRSREAATVLEALQRGAAIVAAKSTKVGRRDDA